MSLFAKRKPNKFEETIKAAPAEQIHVMPQAFRRAVETRGQAPAPRRDVGARPPRPGGALPKRDVGALVKGLERRILVIGAAVVVLVIVVISGFLFLANSVRRPVVITKPVPAPAPIIPPAAAPAEEAPTAALPSPGEEEAITEVIPPLFGGVFVMAPDADSDGLTDEEEKIYGSDPTKPDTDEDGFLDSHEVFNLYHPAIKEPVRLESSGAVVRYNNPTLNYNVLYPTGWLPRSLDIINQEVIFTSLTGEFFQTRVHGNPLGLTAREWYQRFIPVGDRVEIEEFA